MERQEGGSDPAQEWGTPGSETGLEEPMWELGVGGSDDVAYPERPGEADCTYYLRTGYCGYGPRCRFNHPTDRSLAVGIMRAAGGEFPERMGQPVCQYYMRTGMCKFGSSCKYDHPRQGGSAAPVPISILGYPLRPGEKECSYYVKTGHCKFGMTCKFHHPQPAAMQVQAPPGGPLPLATPGPPTAMYPTMQSPQPLASQQYGVIPGNWPVTRPALGPAGSYVQGAYSPMLVPQGMVPFPGWNPYQGHVSQVGASSAQPTVGVYEFTQLSASAPAYTGAYIPVPSTGGPSSNTKEQKFPERPGQAECQYYMRNGDCKFGSTCRYHHPSEWVPPKFSFTLSPLGFPLRPGAPLCAHYAQNGMCKFGQACKFDHPMETLSYSPSASSLADMPVAPYPVGSSLGTLAPSSSSSDLRGSNRDTHFTRMPSSVTTPSGSVGSIMSNSGPASNPSAQQSSLSSTISGNKSQGGDVHVHKSS